MNRSLVIKIGGSLLPCVGEIIRTILSGQRNALILPGGGIFTEKVRDTAVEGTAAHWMAIAGMEQYGWYLSTFGIETTETPRFSTRPMVFLPYQYLRNHDPLPHSWEVTSDTISAWLADHLDAELLVLKSIDQIRAGSIEVDRITEPMETNDLDPCFIPFILNCALSGKIINGTRPDRISQFLQQKPVIGTGFGIII